LSLSITREISGLANKVEVAPVWQSSGAGQRARLSKNEKPGQALGPSPALDSSIMEKWGRRRQGKANGNVTVVFPGMKRLASAGPTENTEEFTGSTEEEMD